MMLVVHLHKLSVEGLVLMHTQTCYDGYLFFHPDLHRIVELLTVLQESECDSCRDSCIVDIPLTTISLYT